MFNGLASVLKSEIRRLARSEAKDVTSVARRAASQHRRDIAELKRKVAALERKVALLEKKTWRDAAPSRAQAAAEETVETILREQEQLLSGQRFSYDPAGRRDPFRNLFEKTPAAGETRPPGPDGMLVSHIRFRGLEGDRFATTRPISVDSQWLQRLLVEQEELIAWREGGGVTVCDGLGVRALKRFYDPDEADFNNRRIAREAFLAGNDLLILSQFALTNDWGDQADKIKSTITFFQERYENDPSFQTAVDEAVARILRLKLSLYGGSFDLIAGIWNPHRAGRPPPRTRQRHPRTDGRDRLGIDEGVQEWQRRRVEALGVGRSGRLCPAAARPGDSAPYTCHA